MFIHKVVIESVHAFHTLLTILYYTLSSTHTNTIYTYVHTYIHTYIHTYMHVLRRCSGCIVMRRRSGRQWIDFSWIRILMNCQDFSGPPTSSNDFILKTPKSYSSTLINSSIIIISIHTSAPPNRPWTSRWRHPACSFDFGYVEIKINKLLISGGL